MPDLEKNGMKYKAVVSNPPPDNAKPPPPPTEAEAEMEEEAEAESSITPPDGGWGWVVVFASFMIHILADGITYSFGIFMVELIDVFKADRGTAGLIPAILVGITLGSGPIASSLTNRYGCRLVTIAGAILAFAGLALSAAAQNIGLLYFTIGACTGLGFGLIYLPAIVSVSMYFEKKRAFATGIAVCGSGLGTFLMAPVTKWLINQYGWQGAMLIVAGLVLNCIIFGALFKPLQPTPTKKKIKLSLSGQDEEKVLLERNGTNTDQKKQNGVAPAPEIQVNGHAVQPVAVASIRPFAEQMGMNGKYTDMARMAMSHPAFLNQAERPQIHFGSHSQFQEMRKNNQPHHLKTGVMNRKDILYGGSLINIPEYKRDPQQYRKSICHLSEEAELDSAMMDQEAKICCFSTSPKRARNFNQMLDFSLFKDPIFLMYACSNFLTSLGFNVPYVYTVDRAILWEIDPKMASFLLSVIGIANTIGRIILGWLSDQRWANRLYMYNFCLICCGLSMGLSVFCTDYISQVVYCAVFGVTSGAYVGLTSVVLVDLLGLDKLTNAFGLLLLFQGIASVIGPPIIGALYDYIGNYDVGFYFAGTMIFLSGAMLVFIPSLQRRLAAKATKPKFRIAQSKSQDDISSS